MCLTCDTGSKPNAVTPVNSGQLSELRKSSQLCQLNSRATLRLHLGIDVDSHRSQYGAYDEGRRSAPSDTNTELIIDIPSDDGHRKRHHRTSRHVGTLLSVCLL